MKSIILTFTLVIILFTIGCDKRDVDVPEMTVSLEDKILFDISGGRDITFNYQLEGGSSISGKKIIVEYPSEYGIFVGDNSSDAIVTDENGQASGIFQFASGMTGPVQITSKLSMDHDEKEVTSLVLHTVPDIMIFNSDPPTLNVNSSSTIRLKIQSDDNFIANLKVTLSVNYGGFYDDGHIVDQKDYYTDENGEIEADYISTETPEDVLITATIEYIDNLDNNVLQIEVR